MVAFDYSSRDYGTIKSDLLARAAVVTPEWTDRNSSDFGMMMVDLWSYMGDVLHYYVDRAAGEAVLPKATQRESVLAFANLLDYIPSGRTSAQGTVLLYNSTSSDITIPSNTRFVARSDNVLYQAYSASTEIIPANGSQSVALYEGTLVISPAETLTSSSNGQSAQRYILSNQNVVRDSVVITVYEDGVTPTVYRRVDRLSNASTGERVYALLTTANDESEVVFGTSIRGFPPPTGATITATYAYSSGSGGNLPANAVTDFRDVTPDGINIVSSSAFSGGVDQETIESMKSTIPSVVSTQSRAVTRDDFINYALTVDGVSKATVEFTPFPAGGASAGNASVTVFAQTDRTSDYLTTSDTSQAISSIVRDNIVSTIQPRALLGVDVIAAETINWQTIDLEVTVYVNANSVASFVKNNVEAALDALFNFNNVEFGQILSLGQYYRTTLDQSGVDYAVITKFALEGNSGVNDTLTMPATTLPKKGTVVVTVIGGITST